MEHFNWPSLRSDLPYLEFLRTRNLSAGVYRLDAGGTDKQKPHAQEEIYYVVQGRSRFQSGGSEVGVTPGDVIYVPAGESHRFFDIIEDLTLLVFFAPPESQITPRAG